jgi:alcohol dehydrogenase class IV
VKLIQGKKWFLYSGVHPNPIESDVIESAEAFRKNGCDAVIGFGGGSALDVGKAARLLVKRPSFDLGKFYSESDWSNLAPYIAIPTTAGTGSEVGRSSVVTLDATKRKACSSIPNSWQNWSSSIPNSRADFLPS